MYRPPELDTTCALTDWVEASCLSGNRGSVSRADVEDLLEGASYSDEEAEEAADDIWLEVQRRSRYAQSSYPLNAQVERVFRIGTWEANLPYSSMLAISCVSHYRDDHPDLKPGGEFAVLFEEITELAMASYLQGRALRFGHPRRYPVPQAYDAALGFVCREIHEEMSTTPSFSEDPKDEHVDIVAWIPMGDDRPGKAVYLTQCSTGRRWDKKAPELDVEVWRHFVRWPRAPGKALAIPFVCPPPSGTADQWFRASSQCGVLVDRLRIAVALARPSPGIDTYHPSSEVLARAKNTVREVLTMLPAVED